MQCRKGILPLLGSSSPMSRCSWRLWGWEPVPLMALPSHTHLCFGEKWSFALAKNRGDWCRAVARAARGEEAFSLHPAARFGVHSVLGDAVPWLLLTSCYGVHQTCISKPDELLNWTEEDMLDRVLGLGCEAAHYNADSIASAPPNKCKEQENFSFLSILLLYLRHWQALQICHLLSFLRSQWMT